MAKLAFTKLGLSKNQEVKTIEYNGQDIEIKQYLPVNNKLELISNVINKSMDVNNFINPLRVEVFFALEVIDFYTNISFTDKQKEDSAKLFDLVSGSGLIDEIVHAIPEDEYSKLYAYTQASIAAIYNYRSSILGILEAVQNDYSNTDMDITHMTEELQNPENLTLLKDILTKLG